MNRWCLKARCLQAKLVHQVTSCKCTCFNKIVMLVNLFQPHTVIPTQRKKSSNYYSLEQINPARKLYLKFT